MIVDFFYWTKAQVDDKFLQDMILICDRQITDPAAEVALRNCKQNGGFYQEAPTVAGTWAPPVTGGMSAWSIGQKGRLVTATWTGGSAQPGLHGEFRGTLISHDADSSSIEGFYVITNNGTTTAPRAMKLRWNPKTPNELKVSTGFTLAR